MSPASIWQLFAKTFQLIELLILRDRLPENFQPMDAIELYQGPINIEERTILLFVLHVWNREEYRFELSEVDKWGPPHQQAFCDWVNGKTLGQPCRYF